MIIIIIIIIIIIRNMNWDKNGKCSKLNVREFYQLFRTVTIMAKQMAFWYL